MGANKKGGASYKMGVDSYKNRQLCSYKMGGGVFIKIGGNNYKMGCVSYENGRC